MKPSQEQEECPHSGPHLLVSDEWKNTSQIHLVNQIICRVCKLFDSENKRSSEEESADNIAFEVMRNKLCYPELDDIEAWLKLLNKTTSYFYKGL